MVSVPQAAHECPALLLGSPCEGSALLGLPGTRLGASARDWPGQQGPCTEGEVQRILGGI